MGGSADIAAGAALYKKVNRKPGIVIANIGDASHGLRPGLGGAELRHHGPVQDAVGRRAPGRPADHLQLHEQLLRHGRPDRRRDHGLRRARPRRRRASTPTRCTPSAWTATTRWRWSMPIAPQAPAHRGRARARSCWTPSPTATPATRPSDASSYRDKEEVDLLAGAAIRSPGLRASSSRTPACWPTRACEAIDERIVSDRDARPAAWPPTSRSRPRAGRRASSASVMFSNQPRETLRRPRAGGADAAWRRTRACRRIAAQVPRRHRGRQAGAQEQGRTSTATRSSRRSCTAFYTDPDPGRLRRGEPRLGRRLRLLPRPDRGAARTTACSTRPSPKGAIVGTARRLRPGGRPRPGRADVLRLHGPRRRRDLQPARQVAEHVRRACWRCRWCCACRSAPSTAPSTPRTGPRWCNHIPGLKVVLPGHALRRQGPAEHGPGRHRPGGLLREPAALRHRRAVRAGGARGLLRGAVRPAGASAATART